MVIGFVLGVLATLAAQSLWETLSKKDAPATVPVEEVVIPAAKKGRKSRAKKTKKG